MKAKFRYLLLLLPLLATLPVLAEEGVADARRHMVRGIAAIEMAKSAADLAPAAEEFRRATTLDPTLSAAWYNLGSVQVKLNQFDDAIQSYKRYLILSPQAEDVQKIQDEIIKLEYRQEKVNKALLDLTGNWFDGRTTYAISVTGLEFYVKGTEQVDASESGVTRVVSTLTSKSPGYPMGNFEVTFKGKIEGASVRGIRYRNSFTEKMSKCTIPSDQSEFSGTISDDRKRITLNFPLGQFQADEDIPLPFMESCTGVKKTGESPAVLVLRKVEAQVSVSSDNQPPKDIGFVGMQLTGTDPQLVTGVVPNLSAADAGIKAGDRIQKVDGKDVKDLKIAQLLGLIRGPAGTKVTIELERQGEASPLSFTLVRKAQ